MILPEIAVGGTWEHDFGCFGTYEGTPELFTSRKDRGTGRSIAHDVADEQPHPHDLINCDGGEGRGGRKGRAVTLRRQYVLPPRPCAGLRTEMATASAPADGAFDAVSLGVGEHP